jgi:HEAT repeat protein
MKGDETLPSGAAARAGGSAGGPTVCLRCGERGAARWCETCGFDLTPDEPRPPNSESYAATQREHRWRIEHPDVATAEREAAAAEREAAAAERDADGGGHSPAEQAATHEQIRAAGRKRSLGPLVAALDNRDGRIREDAVVALGRVGDERATGPLLGALRDGDPYVRARRWSRCRGSLDRRLLCPA